MLNVMKITVVLLFASAAAAQTPAPESTVVQALLVEVHQLRLALERANTIAPRIQLTVERMKLQQDRVTRLSGQLEQVRREFDDYQSHTARSAAELQDRQSYLAQVNDPAERKKVADDISQMKAALDEGNARIQSARTRETDLDSRLRSEQATLDNLNDRLNQIERSLDEPRVSQQ